MAVNYITAALSAIAGAALGLLLTYATTISSQNERLAAIEAKLINVESAILRATNDRYTGADAARDLSLLTFQIEQNAKAIEDLGKLWRDHMEDHQ